MQKSSGCVKCQQFFISAADVVLKSPEWVLQNQYTDICRAMGSYSDACLYYLLKNYSAIDGHVKSALQQQMCEVAKLCPIGSTYTIEKALNKLPPQTWKESKNRMCSVCPAFMKNLHLIFREMKTQDQLQNWVVHFCTSLSLPEEFCTKFVTEHYKLILSYFKHNTSYEYICTRGIGLCEYETEIPPIWSLFPVTNSTEKPEKVEKETSANEIKKVETTPLNKEKKFKISWGDALPGPLEMLPVNRFIGSGGECQACTNMFSTVSQYMLTHQDYVNSILNSTCHSTKDYDTCLTFVKKYGHLLKDSAHISPKSVSLISLN